MNGFTLVEMIAVVIILGMIILIAVPIVTNTIDAAKEKAYGNQIDTIKLAAKAWGAEHLSFMPASNESITIYLWSLKNANFIKDSFVNQLTDKEFNNNIAITVEGTDSGFKYIVAENSGDETVTYHPDMPTIIMRAKLKEYVELNTTYVEKGLIVFDNESNFITNYTTKYYDGAIEIGAIDTSVVKAYTVKYAVTYGSETYELEREVIVRDSLPPVLSVPSDIVINASEFGTFNPMTGVTATDNSGEIVTVTIIGSISAVEGSYNIKYHAVDSSGNVTEKPRNITVLNDVAIEYVPAKQVNKPKLTAGLRPIVFNGTLWDGIVDDAVTRDYVLDIDDPSWYDYSQFKWGNAVTEDGSYWVWIPRFAYKIETNYHTKNVGTVSIKFLKNDTNEASDGTIVDTVPTYTGSVQNNYIVHPAFNFGGTPVSGFWFAKFEPTAVEGIDDLGADLSTTISYDNVTTKTPLIKPGKVSWRLIQNYHMFVNSREMELDTVYGFPGTGVGIDTHAAKNSEWGALTLLTQSQYGKPGNPTYDNTVGLEKTVWKNPNSNHLTGCAGATYNAASSTVCNNFSTANGIKTSSTGTIYGVYDMFGGAWEVVMGTLNQESSSTSGFPSITAASENGKYIDLYTGYNAAQSIGDTTYEMSSSQGVLQYNTWYGGYSLMPSSIYPFFSRGCGDNTSQCSMYGFAWNFGKSSLRNTWRPILMVGSGL